LLAERGQKHDPAVLGEPVGDPASGRAEREPQLEQSVAEAPRQRHPGCRPERDQPVDHHDHPVPFVVVERVHPPDDLVMQLDLSHKSEYRTNAMIAQQRSSVGG